MTLLEALRKNGSQLCDTAADALEDAKDEIGRLNTENARLRAVLEIIAGKRQCVDNTLSNVEIARMALWELTDN